MNIFQKNKLKEYLFIFCLLMGLGYICLSALGLFIVDELSYGIYFGFLALAYFMFGIDFGNQFRRSKPEVFKVGR